VVYRVEKSNVLMEDSYSEEQVISMLEFLIDNIFVSFGGILFQHVVGIPMGTNCVPLRYTDSDYPFGISKLFFEKSCN
jgi:hypothetical protein